MKSELSSDTPSHEPARTARAVARSSSHRSMVTSAINRKKGKSREQRQHQIKREKKAKKIIGKASASHGSRRQGAGTAPAKSNKKKRIRDTRKRNLELAANAMVEA